MPNDLRSFRGNYGRLESWIHRTSGTPEIIVTT